jgi:general secretion pathway protein M
MTIKDSVTRVGDAWNAFWKARNRRERSMLMTAAAVCAFGMLYVLLIDPAVTGTASLSKSLPLLRQQAAQMRQLATQMSQQPRQAVQQTESAPAPPLASTREAFVASLRAAGLSANGIDIDERGVRLQFASVPSIGLIAWLEQAQAQHFFVADAQIDMLSNDTAKASLTLTKTEEEQQ